MYDTSLIADALVTALQSIPELVGLFGNDPTRIFAYKFLFGEEFDRQKTLYKMLAGSIAVIPEPGPQATNRDATTMWLHTIHLHVRMPNAANTAPSRFDYYRIWYLVLNRPCIVGSSGSPEFTLLQQRLPIKNTLGEDVLEIPLFSKLPKPVMERDEEGMDYLHGQLTFPEIGDNVSD